MRTVLSRVRDFIETTLEEELSQTLARPPYGRRDARGAATSGVRHSHREHNLAGAFGKTQITAPPAWLAGCTYEWRSASLRAYQRRKQADHALIARGLPKPQLLIADGAAGLKKRSGRAGPPFTFNAAQSTSIAICSLTRRSGCTRKPAMSTAT